MKVYATVAKLFCGARVFPVSDLGGEYAPSLIDIDTSSPDAELFEACLRAMAVRWSSTGGAAHFKASMAKDGRVTRMTNGMVSVMGVGWAVRFSNPSIDAEERELILAGRFVEAAKLREPVSVTVQGT